MNDTASESLGSDQWLKFLREAPQKKVSEAIEQAQALAIRFGGHQPTANRLRQILNKARSIYTSRFGEEWTPF